MGIRKYINDYRKEDIVKPNGKPGMTASYIGKYYNYTRSPEQVGRTGFQFGIFSLVALVLCVIPLCFPSEGRKAVYVTVPHVIALFPLTHLLLGVYSLRTRKPPLIREFRDKTEGRITASSAAGMCILGVTAISQLINCMLAGFGLPDIIYLSCLAIAGGVAGWIFFHRGAVRMQECDKDGNPI